MIQFRVSASGYCTKHLVAMVLEPETTKAARDRELFLRLGHDIQRGLTHVLRNAGVEVDGVEAEGVLKASGFTVTGHVDGILDDTTLLQVKAVQARNWEALAETQDWRDKYGHYEAAEQMYLGMAEYRQIEEGTDFTIDSWEPDGAWKRSVLMFVNRDTSQVLSGIPVDHPVFIHRPDMIVRANSRTRGRVLKKFERAAKLAEKGTIPHKCDAKGWCYFCQQFSPDKKAKAERILFIEDSDLDHVDLWNDALKFRDVDSDIKKLEAERAIVKERILLALEELKADGVDFEDGDSVLEVRRSLIEQARPDSDEIKRLVNAGVIPKVGSAHTRLSKVEWRK